MGILIPNRPVLDSSKPDCKVEESLTQENLRSHSNISPKLLREAWTRERDSKWLSSVSGVILRKYRGKYVAVKNRKILALSQTMKGLYAKIDKLDPGMVLITRIEKPALLV